MVEKVRFQTQEIAHEVAPGVLRMTIEDGEWGFGSPNFYIISGKSGSVVIDSGTGSTKELRLFKKTWEGKRRMPIKAVVVTHNHFDHDGGSGDISGIVGAPLIGGLGEAEEEQIIDLGGRRIGIFPTPGHTKDSLCVWDNKTNGLFTGDTIIEDVSVVVSDMTAYNKTLEELRKLASDIIFPGHGNPIPNAPHKIQEYITRTHRRERMIVKFIQRGLTDEGLLAKRMYPNDNWGAGRGQIHAHLKKLQQEGRVEESDGKLKILK